MNKLSEKEIEAIRNRAEKATDGPWICDENDSGYIHSKYLFNVVASVIEYNDDGSEHITLSNANHENNRRFIAHAREDIPKLLSEIERLQENVRYLERLNRERRTNVPTYNGPDFGFFGP